MKLLAWLLSRPWVLQWLIAFTYPYRHITGKDGSIYMYRYWLFNGYDSPRHKKWLPSIRLHRIMRPDSDRHMHDHPWRWARTFVLKGWYREERPSIGSEAEQMALKCGLRFHVKPVSYVREVAYTGLLMHGCYHRITEASPDGVWTLFITGPKTDTWGFLVDGERVPYKEYLGEDVSDKEMYIARWPDGAWTHWAYGPPLPTGAVLHRVMRYNPSVDQVIHSEPV